MGEVAMRMDHLVHFNSTVPKRRTVKRIGGVGNPVLVQYIFFFHPMIFNHDEERHEHVYV